MDFQERLDALYKELTKGKDRVVKALTDPVNYYFHEPNEIALKAQTRAAELYKDKSGRSIYGEGSVNDAAKHMAWMAELKKRTGLPAPALKAIGLGKEAIVDGLGSTLYWIAGKGKSPLPTMKNSLMDMMNNSVGIDQISQEEDTAEAAAQMAGKATTSITEAYLKNLPYIQYEGQEPEPTPPAVEEDTIYQAENIYDEEYY